MELRSYKTHIILPMNAKELKMIYKAETSKKDNSFKADARVGKYGDIILDGFDFDDIEKEVIDKNRSIDLHDPNYIAWLENKVCELLTNKT